MFGLHWEETVWLCRKRGGGQQLTVDCILGHQDTTIGGEYCNCQLVCRVCLLGCGKVSDREPAFILNLGFIRVPVKFLLTCVIVLPTLILI